jgi:hypothetical protein
MEWRSAKKCGARSRSGSGSGFLLCALGAVVLGGGAVCCVLLMCLCVMYCSIYPGVAGRRSPPAGAAGKKLRLEPRTKRTGGSLRITHKQSSTGRVEGRRVSGRL